MQAAADHILVLRQIKGVKLLEARKASRGGAHVGVWSIGWGGGGMFVCHGVHVWSLTPKRKGQFGYLGKIFCGLPLNLLPHHTHSTTQRGLNRGEGFGGEGFDPRVGGNQGKASKGRSWLIDQRVQIGCPATAGGHDG